VGICDDCGGEVVLESARENSCGCGAEYNLYGQRLALYRWWEDQVGEVY
jgi:hypothetical protein